LRVQLKDSITRLNNESIRSRLETQLNSAIPFLEHTISLKSNHLHKSHSQFRIPSPNPLVALPALFGDKFLCTFETRLQMFLELMWETEFSTGFSPCVCSSF